MLCHVPLPCAVAIWSKSVHSSDLVESNESIHVSEADAGRTFPNADIYDAEITQHCATLVMSRRVDVWRMSSH